MLSIFVGFVGWGGVEWSRHAELYIANGEGWVWASHCCFKKEKQAPYIIHAHRPWKLGCILASEALAMTSPLLSSPVCPQHLHSPILCHLFITAISPLSLRPSPYCPLQLLLPSPWPKPSKPGPNPTPSSPTSLILLCLYPLLKLTEVATIISSLDHCNFMFSGPLLYYWIGRDDDFDCLHAEFLPAQSTSLCLFCLHSF